MGADFERERQDGDEVHALRCTWAIISDCGHTGRLAAVAVADRNAPTIGVWPCHGTCDTNTKPSGPTVIPTLAR